MNELAAKYGDRLQILAFPCNQFGHQENGKEEEILQSLKYVRPGGGFEPAFPVFSKVEVNGAGADPMFQFLRHCLPFPSDEANAMHLMSSPKGIIWEPVTRSDIAWNFEKFLVDPEGVPRKRFSSKFETININNDIQTLIEKFKI